MTYQVVPTHGCVCAFNDHGRNFSSWISYSLSLLRSYPWACVVLRVSVCFNDGSFKRSLGCGFCSGRSLPPFLPSPHSRDPSKMLDLWDLGRNVSTSFCLFCLVPDENFIFCNFSLYVLAAHLHLYKTFLELSVLSWKLLTFMIPFCLYIFVLQGMTLEWPCGL